MLFAYETLQDTSILKEVIGRSMKGIPDVLCGYERDKIVIEGETYVAIVPNSDSLVVGRCLSVTTAELKMIDEYETEAFARVQVTLESGVKAWVYVKEE